MSKHNKKNNDNKPIRVRRPHPGEQFGVIINMLGGGRALILCEDDKERIGRIPGSMRRYIWVRGGDYVLIKPWKIEGEKKCNIVWRYTRIQVQWLKRKGYLKKLDL